MPDLKLQEEHCSGRELSSCLWYWLPKQEVCIGSHQFLYSCRAREALWWERLSLTNVARVRFWAGDIFGEFVVDSHLSEGFSPGYSVFSHQKKPKSPNSNSTKIEDPWKPAKPDIWPPLWIFLLVLKCLWNEFFAYFSEKLKSMILWFGIFELILRRSAYEFFLLLRSCPIRFKMCHIPRAVKICKLLQLTSQGV